MGNLHGQVPRIGTMNPEVGARFSLSLVERAGVRADVLHTLPPVCGS